MVELGQDPSFAHKLVTAEHCTVRKRAMSWFDPRSGKSKNPIGSYFAIAGLLTVIVLMVVCR